MSAGFARVVVMMSSFLSLTAGCAPVPDRLLERRGAGARGQRCDPARSGIIRPGVLERNGERFRTGSGVVILAAPDSAGSECLVLSSGHTFAGVKAGDGNEMYVLLDRHHGPATKVRAELLTRRESGHVDLALLRARAPRCLPAPLGRQPTLGDSLDRSIPVGPAMRLISGMVSEVNLDDQGNPPVGSALVVDASVVYGMSGGGVSMRRPASSSV